MESNTVNYVSDSLEIRLNYEVLNEAIQCICVDESLSKSWKSKVEKRK